MSWFRRHLGLDGFDLVIHAGVTVMLLAFIGISDGPEELMPLITAASLITLGIRRKRALAADTRDGGLSTGQMATTRIEELEQRVAELEGAQSRLFELEERLDFAERLLARSTGERAALPDGR